MTKWLIPASVMTGPANTTLVPDLLPAPMGIVYISGVAEIVGGLGTMFPRTRRAAGWFLIATLVAGFSRQHLHGAER